MLMRLFLFCLFMAALAPETMACDCIPTAPPATELQQATAVFSGKIVAVIPTGSDSKNVVLRVYTVWKGHNRPLIALGTPSHEGSCGVDFSPGDEWLIYAYENESGGLETSSCSRTTHLTFAGLDLQFLGRGSSPSMMQVWLALFVMTGLGRYLIARRIKAIKRKRLQAPTVSTRCQ